MIFLLAWAILIFATVGMLVWAYTLDRRDEAAAQMRDALTLGTDAGMGGFGDQIYPPLSDVSDAEWDALERALNPATPLPLGIMGGFGNTDPIYPEPPPGYADFKMAELDRVQDLIERGLTAADGDRELEVPRCDPDQDEPPYDQFPGVRP